MEYDTLITNWLLSLIAALLAVEVLNVTSEGGRLLLDLLSPIANVLAGLTFLAFVIVTGSFFVYAMSFRD
ncbi:hypothetical protein [Halolamina sp.]|jgi:hypothetical protein|uniref:hypothetical protein n=1 Tax=Halolamina sp. TaxID=1940283 RepID=UPI000223B80B|nr:hypothetical protein Halar_0764 [halophilic archaeon DL31]